MKDTTKIYLIGIAVLSILLACIIVPRVLPKYNTDWIIGKSVDEVVDRYGGFLFTKTFGETTACYYVLEEEHYEPLFGDYIPPKYLVIYFDGNSGAYEIKEMYQPGG